MVEFLERNGGKLKLVGKREENSMVDVVVAVAASEMSEAEFATFVRAKLEPRPLR